MSVWMKAALNASLSSISHIHVVRHSRNSRRHALVLVENDRMK